MIADTIDDLHYQMAEDQTDEEINDEKADAILYVIQKEREKMQDITLQAGSQCEKIIEWQQTQCDNIQRKIDDLQARLYQYFSYQVLNDPDLKTKTLPNGTMKIRKQQPLLVVEDRAVFFKNLGDKTELTRVTTKHEPDKKAIMKYIKDTGDVPDGIVLEERDVKFTIKTGD